MLAFLPSLSSLSRSLFPAISLSLSSRVPCGCPLHSPCLSLRVVCSSEVGLRFLPQLSTSLPLSASCFYSPHLGFTTMCERFRAQCGDPASSKRPISHRVYGQVRAVSDRKCSNTCSNTSFPVLTPPVLTSPILFHHLPLAPFFLFYWWNRNPGRLGTPLNSTR